MAVAMIAGVPLMMWIDHAAKRFDLRAMRIGLPVAALLGSALVAMRWIELASVLHVKWNTNAYGSALWLVLGSHGTLLLIEAAELIGFALAFWFAPIERKHFSDVTDAAFYWHFMTVAGTGVYVLCFLLPRWI
jgi:heme/copper-type cytochrome/quinol oxidase subunit 3